VTKKQCTKCKATKTLRSFHKDANKPDGYASNCKLCRKKHKEKATAEGNAYHQTPIARYKSYQRGAKQRSLKWELTEEEFLQFWQRPCFYCTAQISTIGLDRLDNNLGYTMTNVVPCCTSCNFLKGPRGADDFISKCFKIGQNKIPYKLLTSFTVDSKPISTNKGYFIGNKRMFKTKEAVHWQAAIKEACPYTGEVIQGKKIHVEIDFFFKTTASDVDGPTKFTMDALEKIVYFNDKQIYSVKLTKNKDKDNPHAKIRVYEIIEL